jgi:hypothetical protein
MASLRFGGRRHGPWLASIPVAAIVELTPLTHRGRELLDELEHRTGLLPFKTSDMSGAKTYFLPGSANVDGFQAALDRIEPNWVTHLMFRDVTRTG